MLKEELALLAGEVIDTSVMNVAALREFYAEQIDEAKEEGVLLSLHLKATMMKVSDPIMFGHCVSVYFADALDKHADGPGGDRRQREQRPGRRAGQAGPAARRQEGRDRGRHRSAVYASGPALAMVDSRKGITNLHVPNNVIIDASMPNVVRDGGRMWNKDDELQDTIAMVPDRCYATMYQAIIEDCQQHGQFDPATMGNVANVGLMAKKAEEYGSHDKTFMAPGDGRDPRGGRRRRGAAGADRRARRHLPHVPGQGRADPRLGEAGASPAPGPPARRPSSGSTRTAATTPRSSRRSKAYLPEHDTNGPGHPHHEAGGRHEVHPGAGPPRRGHHRRHRQRAA